MKKSMMLFQRDPWVPQQTIEGYDVSTGKACVKDNLLRVIIYTFYIPCTIPSTFQPKPMYHPFTCCAPFKNLVSCPDYFSCHVHGGGTSERSCGYELLCRQPVSILSHIQGDVNVIHKFDAITILWLFLNHSCSEKTQLENQC